MKAFRETTSLTVRILKYGMDSRPTFLENQSWQWSKTILWALKIVTPFKRGGGQILKKGGSCKKFGMGETKRGER